MMILARIIKSKQVSNNGKEVFKRETINEYRRIVQEETEKILEDCRVESEDLIKEIKRKAEIDAEDARKAGYEEGLDSGKEEGYKAGFNKAKEEVSKELRVLNNNKIKELTDMIVYVEERKKDTVAMYESKITDMALMIAEKILKKQIDEDSDYLKSIIMDVVDDYKNISWIKIYLSEFEKSRDIEADNKIIEGLQSISKDVSIIYQEGKERGTCIIETPDNITDASVGEQLENLKDSINKEI